MKYNGFIELTFSGKIPKEEIKIFLNTTMYSVSNITTEYFNLYF